MTRKPERDATLDHAMPPTPRKDLVDDDLPIFDVGPPEVDRREERRPEEEEEPEEDDRVVVEDPDAQLDPGPRLLPAPPDPLAVGAGLEEFGAEDVRIPILKLRQAQTKNAEGVPDGSWFLVSDPESHALGREVVFLDMRKERSLLLPYAGGDVAGAMIDRIENETGVAVPPSWDGPVCFSRDRLRPVVQEGINPLAHECGECPMRRWRTTRGRRVQDCAESYRVLLYDMTFQLPCVFFARGSAIRPMRDLLTNLQVACRRHRAPAYGFMVDLTTKKVDTANGTYFVPVFGRPIPIEDKAQVVQFAQIRRACASVHAEEESA